MPRTPRVKSELTEDVKVLLISPWEVKISPFLRACRQRILVVTDGGLNYNASSGFGLTEFLAALGSGSTLTPPIITKAHRSSGFGEDLPNFRFDKAATTVTTANYDQLWLFGIASGITKNPVSGSYSPSNALNDEELKVIAKFMESGGGVFATGDHATLGFAMNGRLLRVRQMRDWQTIPMGLEGVPASLNRIDTVTNPGGNNFYEFDDQSDEHPQRIYPHYKQSGSNFLPHPLLRSGAGDIDVLPDHPHESLCLTANNPAAKYTEAALNLDEFPTGSGSQPLPEIVAVSVSGGRAIQVKPGVAILTKPPVTPRCFGAISAYDGYSVGRGRIVCDSTWHHFVNINLNGVGTPAFSGLGSVRTGLNAAALGLIKQYYRNIVDWVTPQNRRWCFIWADLIRIRYRDLVLEELPWPLPPEPPWPLRVRIGAAFAGVLSAERGAGYETEIVRNVLQLTTKDQALLQLIDGTLRGEKEQEGLSLLEDELIHGILGGMAHQLINELPPDPAALEKILGKKDVEERFLETISGAALTSMRVGLKHVAERSQRIARLAEELSANLK